MSFRQQKAHFHHDFQDFFHPELIFLGKENKCGNLYGLVFTAPKRFWKYGEIRLITLHSFQTHRVAVLFTLLKSLSSGQEFWGLWGILTAWLVGDRSVHTTRFWISRRREKWQELCERNAWVDVFHRKHRCRAEKGPSRLFMCYYVVEKH